MHGLEMLNLTDPDRKIQTPIENGLNWGAAVLGLLNHLCVPMRKDALAIVLLAVCKMCLEEKLPDSHAEWMPVN